MNNFLHKCGNCGMSMSVTVTIEEPVQQKKPSEIIDKYILTTKKKPYDCRACDGLGLMLSSGKCAHCHGSGIVWI